MEQQEKLASVSVMPIWDGIDQLSEPLRNAILNVRDDFVRALTAAFPLNEKAKIHGLASQIQKLLSNVSNGSIDLFSIKNITVIFVECVCFSIEGTRISCSRMLCGTIVG